MNAQCPLCVLIVVKVAYDVIRLEMLLYIYVWRVLYFSDATLVIHSMRDESTIMPLLREGGGERKRVGGEGKGTKEGKEWARKRKGERG